LFDPQQFSDSRPNDKINGPNDDSNSVASFDDVANESLFAYEPFSLPESSSKDLTSAKIRAVKKATFARPPKARVAREDGGLTKHKRFSSQTKQVVRCMKCGRLLNLFSGKRLVPFLKVEVVTLSMIYQTMAKISSSRIRIQRFFSIFRFV